MLDVPHEARFVVDGSFRIVEWGPSAAAAFGCGAEAALGRRCADVVSASASVATPCHARCSARRRIEAGRPYGDAVATGEAGGEVRCRLTALPSPHGGAVATVRLGPRPADAPPSDVRHDLAAFASLAASLAHGSLAERIRHTLEHLRDVLGADAAEAFLRAPFEEGVVLAGHRGPFRRAFEQRLRFAPGEGIPGRVLETAMPLDSAALADDERYLRDRVIAAGFRGYACVPLPSADGPIGALAVAYRAPPDDLARRTASLAWYASVVALSLQAASTGPGARNTARRPCVRPPRTAADGDAALTDALEDLVTALDADGADVIVPIDDSDALAAAPLARVGDAPSGACAGLRGGDAADCPALATRRAVMTRGDRAEWPAACRRGATCTGTRTCFPLVHGPGRPALLRVRRARRSALPLGHDLIVAGPRADLVGRLVAARTESGGRSSDLRREAPSAGASEAADAGLDRAAPPIEVRCLGRFEVRVGGMPLAHDAFRRRKAATLLAVLAAQAGRTVTSDELVEALWPNADPVKKTPQLHVLVHELRRVLNELIERSSASPDAAADGRSVPAATVRTEPDGYRLILADALASDLFAFEAWRERAFAAARRGDAAETLRWGEPAAALYRGPLFEDLPYAQWCWHDRERYREACRDLRVTLAEAADDLGAPNDATRHWEAAVALDPLREDAHRGLMAAYWRAGRRESALAQYLRCRALLQRELGVEPLPATTELAHRIRAAEAA